MSSFLKYGTLTFLEPVLTEQHQEEPTYDDIGAYLYHTVRTSFMLTFNPASTSARLEGALGGQTINFNANFSGPTTKQALESYLLTPRRQLIYNRGGVDLIYSPLPDHDRDAKNGPLPVHVSVAQEYSKGEKTFTIHWVVETYVRRCDRFVSPQLEPFLLSHTWSESHVINRPDLRTTRNIVGRMVFHQAKMWEQGWVPDDFRRYCLPLPPYGWRREMVSVTAEADAATLTYNCIDTEHRLSLRQEGISDIQCSIDKGIERKSLLDAGINIVQAVPGALSGGGNGAAGMASGAGGILNAALSALPREHIRVAITVQGTPETSFNLIQQVAYRAAAFQLTNLIDNFSTIVGGAFSGSVGGVSIAPFWGPSLGLARWLMRQAGVGNAEVPNTPGTGAYSAGFNEHRETERGLLILTMTLSSGLSQAFTVAANGVVTYLIDPAKNAELDKIDPETAVFVRSAPVNGASMPRQDFGTRHNTAAVAVAQHLVTGVNRNCKSPLQFGEPTDSGQGSRRNAIAPGNPHTAFPGYSNQDEEEE